MRRLPGEVMQARPGCSPTHCAWASLGTCVHSTTVLGRQYAALGSIIALCPCRGGSPESILKTPQLGRPCLKT